jgi:hypothetical protein
MDQDEEIRETLDVHRQSIQGLVDNQLMLAAQVHVLQAALATMLLHHNDRATLLRTFKGYMKISKESDAAAGAAHGGARRRDAGAAGPGDGAGEGVSARRPAMRFGPRRLEGKS